MYCIGIYFTGTGLLVTQNLAWVIQLYLFFSGMECGNRQVLYGVEIISVKETLVSDLTQLSYIYS